MEPEKEPPTEHDAISAYLDQTLNGQPYALIYYDPDAGHVHLHSNIPERDTGKLIISTYERLQNLGHIPKPRRRGRRPS